MKILKRCCYWLAVKPLVLLWLGIHVRSRQLLPRSGPAILAANHNSHLDVLALLSLFPAGAADRVKPVAAADYFLRNKWLAWFAVHIVGISLEASARRAG